MKFGVHYCTCTHRSALTKDGNMNLNIFKRIADLENEVAALRGLLYEHLEIVRKHVIKEEAALAKSQLEKIAKRKEYMRQWYMKNKAKKQAKMEKL